MNSEARVPRAASPTLCPSVTSWYGNAAKMRIIGQILAKPGPKVVFDYGAGSGAGWARTLAEHPEIKLVCYEPSKIVHTLRRALPTATVVDDLDTLELQADFIVSFSVFEHVFDRKAYLVHARRLLAPNGVLFLNYDDGHFRKRLDLSEPSGWSSALREHFVNLLAPVWPSVGQIGRYQARVPKRDADEMVTWAGLRTIEARYENLASLKALAAAVPEAERANFARRWLDTEDQLNRDFDIAIEPRFGDQSLLWREMASRTLTLVKA